LRMAGHSLGDAGFLALSAFANSGLSLEAPPTPTTFSFQGILMPLSWAGGIGITVLIELWDRFRHRRPLTRHAWATIAMSASVFLAGIVLLLACVMFNSVDHFTPHRKWQFWEVIPQLAGLSQNARSAGFFTDVDEWGRPAERVIKWLMMIGAGSGGTGGGLKLTTLLVLMTCLPRILASRAQKDDIRLFHMAFFSLTMLVATIGLSHFLLLAFVPEAPADRLLFLAVSAVSNVGLSHEAVGLTGAGLWIISLAMLAGRILPILILWRMAALAKDQPFDLAVA